MNDAWTSELSPEHAALLEEARPGIERLVARRASATQDVVFLVADVESALGKVILGLGVPRHPTRRSVVMPLTRADALRAAGPLMSPSLTTKLDAQRGPAALVMVGDSARLVALQPPDGA
jgi:hypothetical protein